METVVKIIEEDMFSWRQEGEGEEARNSENVWGELQQQDEKKSGIRTDCAS